MPTTVQKNLTGSWAIVFITVLAGIGGQLNSYAQDENLLEQAKCITGTWENADKSVVFELTEASAQKVAGKAYFSGGPKATMDAGSFDGKNLTILVLLKDFPDVSDPVLLEKINNKIPKRLVVTLTPSLTLEGTISLSDFQAEETDGKWGDVVIDAHFDKVPITLKKPTPPVDDIKFMNTEGELIEEARYEDEFRIQVTFTETPSDCVDYAQITLAVVKEDEKTVSQEVEVIETGKTTAIFESELFTLERPEKDM